MQLTTKQRTRVDWFLTILRIAALALIGAGLLAFIAQTIDSDNWFAQWANPDSISLTGRQFRDLVVAGLAQGAMYGLIALGYSMVYGVLGFINFAHGEVFMIGAVTGAVTTSKLAEAGAWESNFVLCLLAVFLISTVVCTTIAVIMERVAYRPLRGKPRLIPLITSIGVSFFLQNFILVLLGPNTKTYPKMPDWLTEKRTLLDIQGTRILVLAVAAIAMVGLWYLVERTKTGKAMRAVAEDAEIASLMGIDVNRIIVKTFAVGGAMAGVAGILWGLLFNSVLHTAGFLPGIKAFSAAVVGGIGNIGGSMAGGLTIGVAESLGPLMILEPLGVSGPSQLRDAVAFAVLIIVLLVRPSGIFGERLPSEERT